MHHDPPPNIDFWVWGIENPLMGYLVRPLMNNPMNTLWVEY